MGSIIIILLSTDKTMTGIYDKNTSDVMWQIESTHKTFICIIWGVKLQNTNIKKHSPIPFHNLTINSFTTWNTKKRISDIQPQQYQNIEEHNVRSQSETKPRKHLGYLREYPQCILKIYEDNVKHPHYPGTTILYVTM